MLLVLLFLCVISPINGGKQKKELPFTRTRYAVKFNNNQSPEDFAIEHNVKYIDTVLDYHIFETRTDTSFLLADSVVEHHKQERVQQHKRTLQLKANDPLYNQQWHLQSKGVALPYNYQYTGRNVNLAIVDDGLQHAHPDINNHYVGSLSYDFNDRDGDPTPNVYRDDGHGTSAAGVCCAIQKNNHCGQGVAPNVNVVGLRLIAAGTYDYEEAQGLTYKNQQIDIYSCSWGPEDSGEALMGPGRVTQDALSNGFVNGRHGKGSIFVWAGGNGRGQKDNGNYDGYANHYATMAIGAVDYTGQQSWYSEDCACLMAVTPSSGVYRKGITTIDLMGPAGYDSGECTADFGGTSSACPLAAGIVALMLEKDPSLTNRDIMHIIAKKATKINLSDRNADWSTLNTLGYSHSHRYGFGLLKVEPLLDYIPHHVKVPTMKTIVCPSKHYNSLVPSTGSLTLDYTCQTTTRITFIEQVLVKVTWMHRKQGQLKFVLKEKNGRVESILADQRPDDSSGTRTWTFNTLRFWGSSLNNSFQFVATDLIRDYYTGRIMDIQLTILGY